MLLTGLTTEGVALLSSYNEISSSKDGSGFRFHLSPGSQMLLSICPSPDSPPRSSLYHLYPNAHLSPFGTFTLFLIIPGALLCYKARLALSHHFTWDLTILPSHKLITSFPYSLIRHPTYTGALLIIIGESFFILFADGTYLRACLDADEKGWKALFVGCTQAGMGLVLGWWMKNVPGRCIREDALLREAFGEEWDKWAVRTKWKLNPGLY